MQIIPYTISGLNYAEIISEGIIISTTEDMLQILGTAYYDGYTGLLLHEANIIPAFFDLKTKLAGDMLQKFSNYRMRLIIIGDFSKYASKSLHDFIFESNAGKLINFTATTTEALYKLS